jgi:hypothetical protein
MLEHTVQQLLYYHSDVKLYPFQPDLILVDNAFNLPDMSRSWSPWRRGRWGERGEWRERL